ncbi:MAG: SusC/RagA family TonB-linked outer membrane protein, partial [Paludibacter sp.]|nr:SusC/RagA family TonB-linked outer membrane protein [Bacteroidales bacterium]MCM1069686.1 SusC/RagA family TonB-linked outer membrane protein [Prevotella sp.]MCM1354406.1 SusC/RagA family TonB-linked outer membrane protein [Bacteroides sp.]MCM1441953.1 SusC/RagA family TonB-linked outer membrane protein [Muribaculum sp.]MCM1482627.1 SusC/RagA family TonB-linked outer membrane protein [Paludibacter sp.]
SATAIYGSRASNGVIIITTKKGAAGQKLKVNYDGNVSFGTLTQRMETLSGDELRVYAVALGHKDSKTQYLGTENTNWQDQIYRTAISTDHNISLVGGTKHMPYRASIGYTDQNGIIKTSNMQRVTASLNLNPSFLDKHLTFNLNAKGMYIYNRYADGGVVGSALSMDPTMPVRGGSQSINGNTLVSGDVINQWFGGYYQRVKTGNYNDSAWPYTNNAQTTANPLATLEQKNDHANSGAFVGNLEADYKIHGFEDLRLHANFGADYSYGKQVTSISPYSYSNHYYGWEGYAEKHKYNLQFNAYAQYYKDFSESQHFDVMVGYEWQHFYSDYNTDGFGSYQLTNNDPALAGQPYTNRYTYSTLTENYLVSFFGRANWIGWNQLMLTATFRADGSSRFAPEHRWGLFPSVALGWKIKEAFMKDVNWLDDLKLRLGYGITGQQEINQGDYPYLATYTLSQAHAYYPIGGENYLLDENGNPVTDASGNYLYYSYRPGAYNSELTWEKTTTYNAGIDFAFLNNRISGAIDYYYRNTTDLINVVDLPAGTNFKNRVVSNVGSLRNQGVEFSLNAVAIDRKNFKWDLGFNATWNDNKITKLTTGDGDDYYIATGGISAGTGNNIQAHKVGYAASSFYVYETTELQDANGNTCYAVVDRNHDGEITAADKYIYKDPSAKVTLGLQSKWQFYGFDLGITLRASLGNYVYNDVLASNLQWVESGKVYQAQNGGYHGVLTSAYETYWKTGMRSDGMYAVLYNQDGTFKETSSFSDWYAADYFVEKASFLRIDNITLGYTFDKPSIRARLYCTVSNPCVFSPYSGLDPEIFGGIDNNIYPRSMTTIVGVSLQF